MDLSRIQDRRDALAAQLETGRRQYAELEATLRALDRNLCAMAGGVQELDALLAELGESSPIPAGSSVLRAAREQHEV